MICKADRHTTQLNPVYSKGSGGPSKIHWYCVNMEGIFIPKDILKMKELTSTEKMVLALYKYYTDSGKYKCCSLTNCQIAEELCISTRQLRNIKSHLKDLGYIKTVGVKVFFLGVKGGNLLPPQGGNTVPGGRKSTSSQRGNPLPPREEIQFPHKEEKKDKKEIKKEPMTNLDLLLDRLPEEYKTQERIDYIKTTYNDRLNEVDFTEGGILDTWVTGIKIELNKRYPIEYIIKKEEPINNTVDVL